MDIVEKLKESVRLTWSKSNEEMCKAAIDEIEQLRKEVQVLRLQLDDARNERTPTKRDREITRDFFEGR